MGKPLVEVFAEEEEGNAPKGRPLVEVFAEEAAAEAKARNKVLAEFGISRPAIFDSPNFPRPAVKGKPLVEVLAGCYRHPSYPGDYVEETPDGLSTLRRADGSPVMVMSTAALHEAYAELDAAEAARAAAGICLCWHDYFGPGEPGVENRRKGMIRCRHGYHAKMTGVSVKVYDDRGELVSEFGRSV